MFEAQLKSANVEDRCDTEKNANISMPQNLCIVELQTAHYINGLEFFLYSFFLS